MNIPEDLSGPRQGDYEALCERFGQDVLDAELERFIEERLSQLWNNRDAVDIND